MLDLRVVLIMNGPRGGHETFHTQVEQISCTGILECIEGIFRSGN